MHVVVSGASVAGPVVAYWLARHGFEVTVVERAPEDQQHGGHAVDLFRPAMQVVERMGVVDKIRAHATGMDSVTAFSLGSERAAQIDLRPIFSTISEDHVEIMRGDLSDVLREATTDLNVQYRFGSSIAGLHDGDVRLDDGTELCADVIVGADGLHSNVRRLAFRDDEVETPFLGTYLAVATVPKPPDLESTFSGGLGAGRLIGLYSTGAMHDARLVFLYRPNEPLSYDRDDKATQKQLLKGAYADCGPQVARWLGELDSAEAFYLEGISQVVMNSWSRGRVALAGDAGYCPGPAVGGGTSLAVVGAYVLAGQLAECHGNIERAFAAYESTLQPYVLGCRRLGRRVARILPPKRRATAVGVILGARAVSHVPGSVLGALGRLDRNNTGLHDSVEIRDYAAA